MSTQVDINTIDSSSNSNNSNGFNNQRYQEICNTIKDILEINGDNWYFYTTSSNSTPSTTTNDGEQSFITLKKLLLDETIIDDQLKNNFFENSETDAAYNIFNYNKPEEYFKLLNEKKFYYPPKPFYKHISLLLLSWNEIKEFPITFDSLDGLFEVDKSEQEKENTTNTTDTNTDDTDNHIINPITYFKNMNEQVLYLFSNWDNIENRTTFLTDFFRNLNNRNILTLFNVRKTKLSIDTYFLECPLVLIKYANQLHSPKSKSLLTVASRALCKHGIRSENSFWGSDKGPEMIKNKRAEKVLIKVLTRSFWINIHLLPHNIPIIEIRNSDGYGLRWSASGDFFRGFLEPQMPDGHEKGWKH